MTGLAMLLCPQKACTVPTMALPSLASASNPSAKVAGGARAKQVRRAGCVLKAVCLASTATAAPGLQTATVKFSVPFQTQFGEALRIVGSLESLGSWDVEAAPVLEWTEGDVWVTSISVPTASEFEFKVVWQSLNGLQWEGVENRSISVNAGTGALDVMCYFNSETVVTATAAPAVQVTAVVDGMPASSADLSDSNSSGTVRLVQEMLNGGYTNGHTVNEVYATIELEPLDEDVTSSTDVDEVLAQSNGNAAQELVAEEDVAATEAFAAAAAEAVVLEMNMQPEEAEVTDVGSVSMVPSALEEVATAEADAAKQEEPASAVSAMAEVAVVSETAVEADASAEASEEALPVEEAAVLAAETMPADVSADVLAAETMPADVSAADLEPSTVMTDAPEEVKSSMDAVQEVMQGELQPGVLADVERETNAVLAAAVEEEKRTTLGFSLPAPLQQVGKNVGYLALGLGAAAALGAVAVDTAAVDAALASALMAAVIIGDDAASSNKKERKEGEADSEDSTAADKESGATAEAKAIAREQAAGRKTSASATPADLVKAVATAAPAKKPKSVETEDAAGSAKPVAPVLANGKALVNGKAAVNGSAPVNGVTAVNGKPAAKVTPKAAAVNGNGKAPAKQAVKAEEPEDSSNLLMAWFRMGGTEQEEAAQKPTPTPASRPRPPKPAPVRNNKYEVDGKQEAGASRAKWWGL